MSAGILLYGPPASGKSTITQAMTYLDPRYRLFQRVKAGVGNAAEYRMSTPFVVEQMAQAGDIIWSNHRYGSTYVIDRPGLTQALETTIPVIHVGQPEAVDAVIASTPAHWLVVDLRCSRGTSHQRLLGRGSKDVPERLAVWEETPPLLGADLVIDTDATLPHDAASLIAFALDEVAAHGTF